ncbi:unnamed protein product, partial [Mesorhabditis spiculigera]
MHRWTALAAVMVTIFAVASGQTIQCLKGEVAGAITTSQIAAAVLCGNCAYCLKLDGQRGGQTYQYRDCGCLNQYQYTCSSTATIQNPSVSGFTGSAYCCNGNSCNSGSSMSVMLGLVGVGLTALFR